MTTSGSSLADVLQGNFDHIIIGGGSAGCVLAARLSEDTAQRVLLIEAGADYGPGAEPAFISDPRCRTLFAMEAFWPLMVEGVSKQVNASAPDAMPMQQARIMGGGSSINGMHAQRGEAADYAEWTELGATGWGWSDVLPFFNKLETDLDFAGPLHGAAGPIKIKRHGPETWSKLSHAVAHAFERRGLKRISDVNVEGGDGIAAVPLNATDHRSSAAREYLTTSVRARKNLTVLPNTTVNRLVFEAGRAIGVEVREPARTRIRGSNIVVSAGSIHSPAILQRSGIGPGAVLQAAGVGVVAAREGVGRRLHNHPIVIALTAHLSRSARSTALAPAPCLMVIRYSSGYRDCPPADMLINLWERFPGPLAVDPLGRSLANFMLILNKSYSEGTITLDPANPADMPVVRCNSLGDRRDLDRMVTGVRSLIELTRSSDFDGLITDRLALSPGAVAGMLMKDTWKAGMLSSTGAILLKGPGPMRRSLLKQAGTPVDSVTRSTEDLEKYVVAHTLPGGHPTGSCRLGNPSLRDTVVDPRCRLLGVQGVRVVDASIFPTPLRAGTNLPTMMAAEKAAAMIAEDARS